MSSKTLSNLVRAAVIAAAVCGIVICCWVLPSVGKSLAYRNPDFAHGYYPWLFFLWTASLPCFAVLGLVWKASAALQEEVDGTI